MSEARVDLNKLNLSVIETFRGYFGIEVQSGEPVCSEAPNFQPVVLGYLDMLNGGESKYELVVGFDQDTIFKVLEKSYGVPLFELNEMVFDGVAEITNAIYGILKEKLRPADGKYDLSLPQSKNMALDMAKLDDASKASLVNYSTKFGPFIVGVLPPGYVTQQ